MLNHSKLLTKAIVKTAFYLFILGLPFGGIRSQEGVKQDAFLIKSLFDASLEKGEAYQWLRYLCKNVGPRLAGSPGAAAAVEATKLMLEDMNFDTVYLQACMAPRWVRGQEATARIVNSNQVGTEELTVTSLGNTIGTGPNGITAEVVEVMNFDELEALGETAVNGKIVFFNRPMDVTQINTFNAYGGAVDQRVFGAARAARQGAVAVIVRSMATGVNDVPHTGTNAYEEGTTKIPAIAVSTTDANRLSQLLKAEVIKIHLTANGQVLSPVLTYNVIAEKRGSTHPDEIILVGGHLDSWDIGEGAHDDGTGCVQAMQVLPLLEMANYQPKRTFRCVLFMNEENGLAGAKSYWAASNAAKEFHLLAIESDRGGFTPRGFSADADEKVFNDYYRTINDWLPLLEPYGLSFNTGGSGADIGGLKSQGGLLLGLYPDSQRYFDYHHTAADVFEAVSRRELQLGAAAMATMVYLIDNYGLR